LPDRDVGSENHDLSLIAGADGYLSYLDYGNVLYGKSQCKEICQRGNSRLRVCTSWQFFLDDELPNTLTDSMKRFCFVASG
jgi:hypothetical protein